jgi:hypothetical protein
MLGSSNESLPEDFPFLSRNHGKTMGNIAYHIAYHIAYQSRGFVSWDSHRKKTIKTSTPWLITGGYVVILHWKTQSYTS